VYLESHGIREHVIVISVWVIAGTVLTVIASHLMCRQSMRKKKVDSPAGVTTVDRQ